MKIALDNNGKRTIIEEARTDETYFCPICHQPLLQKRGLIKAFHFAHFPNTDCIDHWHYDMSMWHYSWQNRFSRDEQEIVRMKDGKIHRADVLLEEKKTVIEFQHSEISISEFEDRNRFYNELGYRVIWVFDMVEEYENHDIALLDEERSEEKFSYRYPKKIFSSIDYHKEDVTLFFQISPKEEGEILLLRVTWVSPKGIYRFCGKKTTLKQFMGFARKEKEIIEYPKNSIPYHLDKNKGSPLIVRNIKTREEYLISSHAMENYETYHHIFGKTSNSFGEYTEKSVILNDAFQPNWVVIWKPRGKKK